MDSLFLVCYRKMHTLREDALSVLPQGLMADITQMHQSTPEALDQVELCAACV